MQSLMDAKQTDGIINFRRWMARTLGEKNCGKLLWLWEFCGSEEMGLECDGSDITAVGALDALVEWLKNSTGREAKVARLESLKEFPDEYLVLLKDGIFSHTLQRIVGREIESQNIARRGTKRQSKRQMQGIDRGTRTEGFASEQCGGFT